MRVGSRNHRTAKKPLVQVQGFTQSEFDPCYFYKRDSDGYRIDFVLYVDSCWIADTGSAQADHDLRILCDRFKLTLPAGQADAVSWNEH
eukprot:2975740-Pleurochrysis_carterae.AAC.2